jgi:hypothetical protein
MPEYPYTWREAVADAHTAAAEAFAYAVEEGLDLDDLAEYDAAHEWADGSEWVIYTYRAQCLWFDSSEVQDCEADALDGVRADGDIDQRITLCVFHALAAEYAEKWRELAAAEEEKRDAHDDDEEDAEEGKPASEPRGFMEWPFTMEVVARKGGKA